MGDPPPQNPNRLSLIHKDNTLVASGVVKLQRRRTTSLQSIHQGRQYDHSGKAYAKEETMVAKHPPGDEQPHGKASTKGASTTTAAKHTLKKRPWRQSIHQAMNNLDGKASDKGARMTTTAKHLLQKRLRRQSIP